MDNRHTDKYRCYLLRGNTLCCIFQRGGKLVQKIDPVVIGDWRQVGVDVNTAVGGFQQQVSGGVVYTVRRTPRCLYICKSLQAGSTTALIVPIPFSITNTVGALQSCPATIPAPSRGQQAPQPTQGEKQAGTHRTREKASNVTPQPATNTPRAGSQTNVAKSKPAVVETVLCAPRNVFSFKPGPVWEGSAGLLVTWFVACDFEIQMLNVGQKPTLNVPQYLPHKTLELVQAHQELNDRKTKICGRSPQSYYPRRACQPVRNRSVNRKLPDPPHAAFSVSPIAFFARPNLASTQPWGGCKHQCGVDN